MVVHTCSETRFEAINGASRSKICSVPRVGVVAMTYDAKEVAKLVVNEGIAEDRPVTNLKLQKLLYFMWIDWYKERKEPLFNDRIEAWHYGPVVPDVYFNYRIFAADPIRKVEEYSIPDQDKDLMIKILSRYIYRSAGALVEDSHAPDTPWSKVGGDKACYAEIRKELMIDEANRASSQRL